MRFVGLALHEPVPDDETQRVSSIWLFRERRVRAGGIERLFAGFDTLLREQGYLAMGGQIVDATVVQARVARLTAAERATIKAGGTPEAWTPARKAQIDHDARWTLKRGHVGHLQRKKARGRPMPRHVARGKVRAAVEHVFAARKRRLGLLVRTVGIARAEAKIGLANPAYNLTRFAWLEARSLPA